jgi:hypothetical protein
MPKTKTQKDGEIQEFDPDHLRIRDVLLMVLLIVLAICLFVGISVRFGHDAGIKWGGLAMDSCLFFVFLLYKSRDHFRRRYFWVLTGVFVGVHFLGWVILLSHVEKWGLLSFGIMAFEVPLFNHLRDRPEF